MAKYIDLLEVLYPTFPQGVTPINLGGTGATSQEEAWQNILPKPRLLWQGNVEKGATINIPDIEKYTFIYIKGKSFVQRGLCCPNMDAANGKKRLCISSVVRDENETTNYFDEAYYFGYIQLEQVSGTQYKVCRTGYLARTQNSAHTGDYTPVENGYSTLTEIWGVM